MESWRDFDMTPYRKEEIDGDPAIAEGWEKVFPVKGLPYWRKGNLMLPVKNIEKVANQTAEQCHEIQDMLMGSLACYLEDRLPY